MRKDPVVLMGMHRSGTTLLVSWMEELGVYMGRAQDGNREALFFQQRNRRMMALAGASWLYPDPFLWWIQDPERRLFLLRRLRRDVEKTLEKEYLPSRNQWPSIWGWKDPRTVYTLELWRELFPDLRLVVIRRHGVDVAVSLIRRAEQAWRDYQERWGQKDTWGPPMDGVERIPLAQAFDLWVRYNARLDDLHRNWPALPWLELRYEQVLKHPRDTLKALAEFLGVSLEDDRIQRLTESLDPDRAWRYRSDPDLRAFAAQKEAYLARYGYRP